VVAAADSTTDIELPAFAGLDGAGNPIFDDVRLTDRDAVRARADVEIVKQDLVLPGQRQRLVKAAGPA